MAITSEASTRVPLATLWTLLAIIGICASERVIERGR